MDNDQNSTQQQQLAAIGCLLLIIALCLVLPFLPFLIGFAIGTVAVITVIFVGVVSQMSAALVWLLICGLLLFGAFRIWQFWQTPFGKRFIPIFGGVMLAMFVIIMIVAYLTV